MHTRPLSRLPALALLAGLAACGDSRTPASGPSSESGAPPAAQVLRVGHFPNVTHAHGLVAHALSRKGEGWFEQRLGPDVRIEWYTYNAGPSAMEAILSGSLDVTYVGPNPALNAYIRSGGAEVRLLAGATNGGAALVVHGDGRIAAPEDFRGGRIATPQLGNTQDVSCRAWLAAQGFHVTQTGGDVSVLPTANPDQLDLFVSGALDGVWTVEPWVSRLELECGGRIMLSEDDAITTVLACSTAFLEEHRDLAKRFVAAHAELTEWIEAHPAEAQALVAAELTEETHSPVKPELIAHCWPRLHVTNALAIEQLRDFVKAAQTAGFLTDAGDLANLVVVP